MEKERLNIRIRVRRETARQLSVIAEMKQKTNSELILEVIKDYRDGQIRIEELTNNYSKYVLKYTTKRCKDSSISQSIKKDEYEALCEQIKRDCDLKYSAFLNTVLAWIIVKEKEKEKDE